MEPEVGDKIKLKGYNGASTQGVVEAVPGGELLVRLDESGELVPVASACVTNFSLAARKAWKNMPHRRVGRPKGACHCHRVSVMLRIDRELWEKFEQDEAEGLIEDRTATINTWFRPMLDKLKRMKTKTCIDAAENSRQPTQSSPCIARPRPCPQDGRGAGRCHPWAGIGGSCPPEDGNIRATWGNTIVTQSTPPAGRERVHDLLEEIGVASRRVQTVSGLNRILVGVDAETDEEVFWNPASSNGAVNPHMLILGKS